MSKKAEKAFVQACSTVLLLLIIGSFASCNYTKHVKSELVQAGVSPGEIKCLMDEDFSLGDAAICSLVFTK